MGDWKVAGRRADGSAGTVEVSVDPRGGTMVSIEQPGAVILDAAGTGQLRAALGQALNAGRDQ